MKLNWALLGAVISVGLLGLAAAAPQRGVELRFLSLPLTSWFAPDVKLEAATHPQALPNDGRTEATISVTLERDGRPLAGEAVTADVTSGDGMLRDSSVTTDAEGRAQFRYRAGLLPQPAVVQIAAADGAKTEVRLPLAAVSYLDLLLVTPEEYAKHKARQTAAAPIYKLSLEGFPLQLAADGGSVALLTAQLLFADGRPAPGVQLRAEVASGEGVVATQHKATDATGRMSFSFTAGRTPGSAVVRIVEPATGLSGELSLLLVEAGPVRIELTCGDPLALATAHEGTLLPADGATQLPVAIRVTDLNGAPLSGVEVQLEVLDHGCGRVELRSAKSDMLGEVKGVYYTGSRTGKVRLRAFAASGLPAD